MAGQRADPEAIARIRDRLGLNDPFMVQYTRYIADALKGDFGESYRYRGRDVLELLGPKLRVSLELNLVSYVVTLVIGFAFGILDGDAPRDVERPDNDYIHVACVRNAGVFYRSVLDPGVRVVVGLDPGFGMVGDVFDSGDIAGIHARRARRVRFHALYEGLYIGTC